MTGTILIADDEETLRENLQRFLTKHGWRVLGAGRGDEAVRVMKRERVSLVISDIRMPDMDGLELLKWVAANQPEIPVILITAYASLDTAIQALREGAADYLVKPIQFDEILIKVRRLLRYTDLEIENRVLRDELASQYGFGAIIGQSPGLKGIFETIRKVAPAKSTALIVGESGTGKELVARAIHYASGRTGRFIAINCGAIPETLLESELFGYRKGAFTGAVRNKEGLFTAAHDGTIFLDEISTLTLSLQVKLLRVVENGEVTPLGEFEPIPVDARVVCATNQDLRKAVVQGQFREDLYFRLNVVEIPIPPLRERREDIPLLVAHFIGKFNVELKRNVRGVAPDAMQRLLDYPWRGNVRELENTIERAMIFCTGPFIEYSHIANCLETNAPFPSQIPNDLHQAIRIYEKAHIQRIIAESHGDKHEAASRLGIGLASVYRKLGGGV